MTHSGFLSLWTELLKYMKNNESPEHRSIKLFILFNLLFVLGFLIFWKDGNFNYYFLVSIVML